MKRIKQVLDVDYDKMDKEEWDNLLIIDGDEGVGKSGLGLTILDYWLRKRHGEVKESDIKYIHLTKRDFVRGLVDLNRLDMIIYDEAGKLSKYRTGSKDNFKMRQSYQAIRGLLFYTIMILPSVFDFDNFFGGRRARGYIHVYKRGEFAFWNKNKLRKLLAYNKNRKVKTPWVVKPLWHDNFDDYKGKLLGPYKKKKKDKIYSILNELWAEDLEDEQEQEQKEKPKTYEF